MPSLPAWVALRIASLKDGCQPDQRTGKRRVVPTLPAQMMLKMSDREQIQRHVTELNALCDGTPANDPQAEEEILLALTKMMLVLPSQTQNELSAEARGEAFLAALDDVPAWAVKAAIRRWYRGAGGDHSNDDYDYHWCPAPAELRSITLTELHRVKGRADQLERLLRAELLIEHSDEHCRKMRAQLGELFTSLRTSLVGKDGSGGVVSAS
jgi:hypothetical protein